MSSSGADIVANGVMTTLLEGVEFPIPTIDFESPDFTIPELDGALAQEVTSLTNDDLTTRTLNGGGTFDALMMGFDVHLKREFEAGRITGNDYTKAYIQLTQGAMANSVQFLLGRDQAFWAAVTAQMSARMLQIQSVTARMEFETAKIKRQAIAFEAMTAEANYALTKMKLAAEDVSFETATYQLDNILPAQLAKIEAENTQATAQTALITQQKLLAVAQTTVATNQASQITAETSEVTYRVANILPQQKLLLTAQTATETAQTGRITAEIAKATADTNLTVYQLTDMLPAQKLQVVAQTSLATAQGQLTGSQKLNTEAETAGITYKTANILPAEVTKLTAETSVTNKQGLKLDEDILVSSWSRLNLLPSQKTLTDNQAAVAVKQAALLVEQTESQRAQTLNNRTDGATITGVLGKQKDLYTQQITSYQRDAEVKAAKLFTDAWTVQKTIDEGLLAPSGFQNTSLDAVLTKIKTANALS